MAARRIRIVFMLKIKSHWHEYIHMHVVDVASADGVHNNHHWSYSKFPLQYASSSSSSMLPLPSASKASVKLQYKNNIKHIRAVKQQHQHTWLNRSEAKTSCDSSSPWPTLVSKDYPPPSSSNAAKQAEALGKIERNLSRTRRRCAGTTQAWPTGCCWY